MKKIVVVMMCFCFFCGCANASPSSAREELLMYRWVQTDVGGNERLVLYFDEFLHVQCKITQTELQETYQLSNTEIIAVNPECGSRTIVYTLQGDTLTLTYDEITITLKKKNAVDT